MKNTKVWEINQLMSQKEKRNSLLIIILIITSGIIETMGVGLILPFMGLISDPEIIKSNSFINTIYSRTGLTDPKLFILFSGIVTLIVFVLGIFLKTFTLQKIIHFIYKFEHSLSERLLKSYLKQPYEWFLTKNTSEIGGKLLSDISLLVTNYVLPIFDGLAQLTVCLFVIVLLFFINAKVTFNILFFLSTLFLLISLVVKSNVVNMGKVRIISTKKRFEAFAEIFGSVKEIKINRNKEIFIQRFSKSARDFAKSQSTIKSYLYIPKSIIEVIVFSFIVIYSLILTADKQEDINKLLPLISLYAIAFYKLLPAIQKIYIFIQTIQFNYPTFLSILNDYNLNKTTSEKENKNDSRLLVKSKISLKGVDYKYPNSNNRSIESINMDFNLGKSTGLVGASGSGKTTIIDLLLGLLRKEKGSIILDNKILEDNQINKLNSFIGYVPQNIFLLDSTIKENIAFGFDQENIEIEKVKWASSVACIDKFIEQDLDNGYDFRVGEKGMKFSGGQRQRIAIARALYTKPKVLILDEATSALDNQTESLVLHNLKKINSTMIIIMVAHRISSIKFCDNLYILEKGKLIGEGKFENLIKINDKFKSILGEINPKEL